MGVRTARERAFPSSQVFRNLGHLYIRIEFVNLIEDGVLIVVTEVVV